MPPLAVACAVVVGASCASAPERPASSEPKREDAGLASDALLDLQPIDDPAAPPPSPPEGASPGVPSVQARTRYPVGPLHSPLTRPVVERLSAVIAAGGHRSDVFAKIGDSLTVNHQFLKCFAKGRAPAGQEELEATRVFFQRTLADGVATSFDRATLAAKVGWSTGRVLEGAPSPIDQELAALDPAFAVVLLGTNDTLPWRVATFEHDLRRVTDTLLGRGVVPLLTTIPPRADRGDASSLVPEMNAIVRAVAQSRRVPMLDLHRELARLPGFGLAGDGIHLSASGMSVRNVVTLQALDHLRRRVLMREGLDPEPPALMGAGTLEDAFVVDTLPFVDSRVVEDLPGDGTVPSYPCNPRPQGGPEAVYKVSLAAPARLRVRVFADDGADPDLHWLIGPTPSDCALRGDHEIEVLAGAGTHRIVVDFAGEVGHARAAGYRLTIVRLD